MSVRETFENACAVSSEVRHPVVLRFKGVQAHALARIVFHDARIGGDLSHVDADQSAHNKRLYGSASWAQDLQAEIAEIKLSNHENAIAALEKKSRRKEAAKLAERGPVDPWRTSEHGPLRDGILTVNKAWFGGTGRDAWDAAKVMAFEETALAFLMQHFPGTQLRHVSAHEDEEAYHIHFQVAVWVENTSKNKGQQFMLQPSANPLLKNYEWAQDLVGAFFSPLGLTRGERRAEARREARAKGEEGPEPRHHVPPSTWRAEQLRAGKEAGDAELKASQKKAEKVIEGAREEARRVLEDARELGVKTKRKSRKRAVKEANARKAEAEKLAIAARAEAQARKEEMAADVKDHDAAVATLRAQANEAVQSARSAKAEKQKVEQEIAAAKGKLDAVQGSIETARSDRAILEGRKEALAKEVGVLVVQEDTARRQIAAAKHAQRQIAAEKDALAEAQRDIALREEALAAETSAHTDGIAEGERILDLLSDDVIDYDPSAKKWKRARNWTTSGIDGAEMRETIRLLPKPMLRFISKTITVVKNILDRERTKIDREWEDVRHAAQTVAEARERLGLEEDPVIFDLTTNPSPKDGF